MTFGDLIDRERREEVRENILDLLEDFGDIPTGLLDRLNSIGNMEILKKLHKIAARAASIEEFKEKMDEVLKSVMAPV